MATSFARGANQCQAGEPVQTFHPVANQWNQLYGVGSVPQVPVEPVSPVEPVEPAFARGASVSRWSAGWRRFTCRTSGTSFSPVAYQCLARAKSWLNPFHSCRTSGTSFCQCLPASAELNPFHLSNQWGQFRPWGQCLPWSRLNPFHLSNQWNQFARGQCPVVVEPVSPVEPVEPVSS